MKALKERTMKIVFLLMALVSVACVALICVFLISSGVPAIKEIGLGHSLLGRTWKPGAELYGIFPMIVGSVYVIGLALLIGVPVALLTAVYLAYFCPARVYRFIKQAVELLAGIPSVVYGFFGIVVLVPAVRALGEPFQGKGNSILTASLLLAIMILPTIIGVLAGIVLGLGRAMGETMAVIMVAGNQARMPKGILQGVRTLTGNIVLEMGYATGLHREALIATGVVLFVFILIINLAFSALKGRNRG